MSDCSISCGGRCCAVFPYPFSPAELRNRWRWWPDTREACRDDLYIADMLVPLDPDEALRRMIDFGSFPTGPYNPEWTPELAASDPGYSLYTCRHWDEVSGLCNAFEDRPKMCREYPYRKQCLHCGSFNDEMRSDRMSLV